MFNQPRSEEDDYRGLPQSSPPLLRQIERIDPLLEVERGPHGAHHGGLAVERQQRAEPLDGLDPGAVSANEVSEPHG